MGREEQGGNKSEEGGLTVRIGREMRKKRLDEVRGERQKKKKVREGERESEKKMKLNLNQ